MLVQATLFSYIIQCTSMICARSDPTILNTKGNAECKPRTSGILGPAQFIMSGLASVNHLPNYFIY